MRRIAKRCGFYRKKGATRTYYPQTIEEQGTLMECTVRWTGDGMTFLAETGSNHVVAMDGAADGGGRNLAPRPMEMVLVGTGGCTASDVVVILKKSGQKVTGGEVKVNSERGANDPKVVTRNPKHFAG